MFQVPVVLGDATVLVYVVPESRGGEGPVTCVLSRNVQPGERARETEAAPGQLCGGGESAGEGKGERGEGTHA